MYEFYNPYNYSYQNQSPVIAPPQRQYPSPVTSTGQYSQNAAQNNTFQWVQGQAGAEAYLVAPGASVILMDSNAPVIYFKSADQNGRYLPMKTYDLVERVPQVQGPNTEVKIDPSSFVKRDELESLVAAAVDKIFNEKEAPHA